MEPIAGWSVAELTAAATAVTGVAADVQDARSSVVAGVGGRLWGGSTDWHGAAARAGAAAIDDASGGLAVIAGGLAEVADATSAAAAILSGPLDDLRSELRAAAALDELADRTSDGLVARVARLLAERRVVEAVAAVRSADRVAAARLDDSGAAAHALLRSWNTAALRELLTAEDLPPGLPGPDTDPETVADWWASRTSGERAGWLLAAPAAIGALAGVPAADRDVANRMCVLQFLASYDVLRRAAVDALVRALHAGDWSAVAAALAGIADLDRRRDFFATIAGTLAAYSGRADASGAAIPVQLLEADPDGGGGGHGTAAVAFGDVDTATNVAFVVPGFRQRVVPELVRVASNAWRVRGAAVGGRSVATIAWLGYDAPMGLTVAFAGHAAAGAVRLSRAVRGVRAARRSRGEPHVSVVGHSYGSTVAGIMLSTPGTPVDDLVVVGSPGLGVDDVGGLQVPAGHVWVGAASGDPVDHLARFGTDPAAASFGARRFDAETPHKAGWDPFEEHSHYFDAGEPSVTNIGAVVAGRPDLVVPAPPRVPRPAGPPFPIPAADPLRSAA